MSDQLSLIKQAQDLAKEFPALVKIKDIFAGLQLGASATAGDLMTATQRVIDATLTTTNDQLEKAKAAGYEIVDVVEKTANGVVNGFSRMTSGGFADELAADLDRVQLALNKVYASPGQAVDVTSLLRRQYAQIGNDKYFNETALSEKFNRAGSNFQFTNQAAALEAESYKIQAALIYNARLSDQNDQLKKQADLIKMVKDAGLNPTAMLANLLNSATGIDNRKYLEVINQVTETLNSKLARSINAVKNSFDGIIATLASGRRSVASIEQQFSGQTVDQQKVLTDSIAMWDKYIAVREEALRSGEGDNNTLNELQSFTANRNSTAQQLETYLRQKAEFQTLQSRLGGNLSDPNQSLMKTYNLDPILARFNAIGQTEENRNQLMVQYRMEQEKILTLQRQQAEFQTLQNRLIGSSSSAIVARIQASRILTRCWLDSTLSTRPKPSAINFWRNTEWSRRKF